MGRSDKSGWCPIHAGKNCHFGNSSVNRTIYRYKTTFIDKNDFSVDRRFHSMTQECAKASAFINEDYGDYCNAWQEQTALTENLVR